MRLPEEIPEELQNSIYVFISCTVGGDALKKIALSEFLPIFYNFFKDYFNNTPVDWRSVGEKPADEGQIVWVTDGQDVVSAVFMNDMFVNEIIKENNITHWAYFENIMPEPPKE